jgi:hypothetical protein
MTTINDEGTIMTSQKLLSFFAILGTAAAQQPQPSAGFSPIPTIAAGSTIPIDSPQFVFLGPTITQLTIAYPAARGGTPSSTGQISVTVKMLNQVIPTVSSTVATNADGTYHYAYSIANDPASPDPIKVWSIAMPAIDAATSATHPSWIYSQVPASTDPNPAKGMVSLSPIIMATWSAPSNQPLPHGGSVPGFLVNSPYRPGLTIMYARSDNDYALPSGLPASVISQLAPMRQPGWMNKRIDGIGPRFPEEWTRDVIAADFKNGIARLIASGELSSSSPFVTALNSALDTLIGAAGASIPLGSVIAATGTPMEANIASAIAVSLQ